MYKPEKTMVVEGSGLIFNSSDLAPIVGCHIRRVLTVDDFLYHLGVF